MMLLAATGKVNATNDVVSQTADVAGQIIQKTNSELILGLMVISIALMAILLFFILPLYRNMAKTKKEQAQTELTKSDKENEWEFRLLDKQNEREAHLLRIVSQNSEVIAGLKATMEIIGHNTNVAFSQVSTKLDGMSTDSKLSFQRIHDRLDTVIDNMTEVQKQLTSCIDKDKCKKEE